MINEDEFLYMFKKHVRAVARAGGTITWNWHIKMYTMAGYYGLVEPITCPCCPFAKTNPALLEKMSDLYAAVGYYVRHADDELIGMMSQIIAEVYDL